jgi:hypothetical protein
MIDLAALTYVAVTALLGGGVILALTRDPARRSVGELVAFVGLALLGAAASRWWGSAELEAAALIVCGVLALRAGSLDEERA